MIDFECPHCAYPIHAQDSSAGKRGKCKSCHQLITVPSPAPPNSNIAQIDPPPTGVARRSAVFKFGLPTLGCILLYAGFMIATAKPRTQQTGLAAIPSDVSFTAFSDDTVRGKRVLDVRLNKRVSKDVLQSIAWKVKDARRSDAKRTFIAFYLPDMRVNAGAWATADFESGLQIQILGVSAEQEQTLSQIPPNASREKIGNWLQDREPFPGKIAVFRENSSLYMEKTFTDGTISKEQVVEQPSNSGRKFMKTNRTRQTDDYYLIDGSGNFQIWSQDVDGSFVLVVTAKRID